jgi:hypothetical protein
LHPKVAGEYGLSPCSREKKEDLIKQRTPKVNERGKKRDRKKSGIIDLFDLDAKVSTSTRAMSLKTPTTRRTASQPSSVERQARPPAYATLEAPLKQVHPNGVVSGVHDEKLPSTSGFCKHDRREREDNKEFLLPMLVVGCGFLPLGHGRPTPLFRCHL